MTNLKYLLLIGLLLVADVLAFSEVAALVRQPSDTSVTLGLLLLVVLLAANFFIIRYSLSKLNSE